MKRCFFVVGIVLWMVVAASAEQTEEATIKAVMNANLEAAEKEDLDGVLATTLPTMRESMRPIYKAIF